MFDCHECRCHVSPPCNACVDCPVCNPCGQCDRHHGGLRNERCRYGLPAPWKIYPQEGFWVIGLHQFDDVYSPLHLSASFEGACRVFRAFENDLHWSGITRSRIGMV